MISLRLRSAFANAAFAFKQQLLTQGSCWGERLESKTKEEQDKFQQDFLQRCGARLRSTDVHWPVQLHLRMMPGPETRASGFRTRSAQATDARNRKKALKGFAPYATRGSSSRGW